jgi:hypothetical protein
LNETSNEIEARIEIARQNLSENLVELEQKVKAAIDWRQQFKAHPAPFLAVAFGAGLLASRAVTRQRRDRH